MIKEVGVVSQIFEHPRREWTWVKNVVLDRIMPALSPEGWKVLCVALRHAGEDGTEETLDVLAFMRKSGITKKDVAQDALRECLAAGYLLRRQVTFQEETRDVYVLNKEFALEPAAGGAEPLTPEEERAFQTLLAFGQKMEAGPAPEQVQAAVKGNTLDAVQAWIETGREMTHLPTAERFRTVMARLLEHVPPLLVPAFEQAQRGDKKAAKDAKGPVAGARDPAALWQATLDQLRPQLKKSQFKWLKPTQGVRLSEGTLTVAVPTRRSKEWLEQGVLTDTIQQALDAVVGKATALVFVVE